MLRIVSATFFRQIFAGLLQVVTLMVIARSLTVAEMGQYTLITLVPNLLSLIMTFGLQSANIYAIGRKKVIASEALYVNYILLFGISIISIFLSAIFFILFGESFFSEVPMNLLIISSTTILPLMFLNVLPSILQATEKFNLFNLICMIQPLFLVGLSLLVAFFFNSLENIIYAFVTASFLTFLILVLVCLKTIKIKSYSIKKFIQKFFHYSIVSHLSNIVTLLNYRSSLLILGYFTPSAQVGLYSVGQQLVEKLWLPSQAVSTILLPKITNKIDEDENKVTIVTLKTARLTFLITSLISILFVILLPFLIHLLFGANYSKSTAICLILLPGIILWAPSRILANDLAARGLAKINFNNALYVLFINLGLTIIFVYYFGYIGAAFATCIAYSCDLILRIYAYKKITGIKVWSVLVPTKEDFNMVTNLVKGIKNAK